MNWRVSESVGTWPQRLDAGALPVRKAIDCALQAARGLAAAHERQVVHRDLKPENLFLTKDGIVKSGLRSRRLERSASWKRGDGDRDRRHRPRHGDGNGRLHVAGAGAGRSGRPPLRHLRARGGALRDADRPARIHKDTSVETLNAILKEEPAEFPRTGRSAVTGRVARHCLEKKPEDRFQSARDLVFELEGFSGTSAIVGRRRPPLPRRAGAGGWAAARRPRPHRRLAGGFRLGRASAPAPIPTYRQSRSAGASPPRAASRPTGRPCSTAPAGMTLRRPRSTPSGRILPNRDPSDFPGASSGCLLQGRTGDADRCRIHVPRGDGDTGSRTRLWRHASARTEGVVCADWAPDGERLAALRW